MKRLMVAVVVVAFVMIAILLERRATRRSFAKVVTEHPKPRKWVRIPVDRSPAAACIVRNWPF